jgi:glycerol uptake facilitator protein
MYSLPQKLAAEFVGTFAFIFIASGSMCADQYLAAAGKPGIGLLGIALAQGLAFAAVVTSLGHISGGHFNPAITVALWVTKRTGTIQAILYWIAQLVGSMAAAYLIKMLISDSVWRPVLLGTPTLATDFTRTSAMALEAVMTFLLVVVFFATAVDANTGLSKIAGLALGLTITADVLAGGPFSGAAINPVRAFGPALAARAWQNHGVYWAGPLIGGFLAGFIYDQLFLRDQPASQ